MMITYKQRAFTLIELLFVIALIGVMITLGLATFEQTTETGKVEKTALQIQQILQAGTTYFVDRGQWPTPNDQDFKNYLPVSDDTNPWGDTYDFAGTSDGYKFQVRSTTPDINTAKRIAALLPGAQASEDTPEVIVEIGEPGSSGPSTTHRPYITQTQTIQTPGNQDNEATFTLPKPANVPVPKEGQCPLNWSARLEVALQGFTAPTITPAGTATILSQAEVTQEDAGDHWLVTVKIQPTTYATPPNFKNMAKVLVVITCWPPEWPEIKRYVY